MFPGAGTKRGLTSRPVSVDDEQGSDMKRILAFAVLVYVGVAAANAAAQDNSQSGTNQSAPAADKAAAPATQSKRLTIEVTGGEKNVAVPNASVYLKYQEGRILRKDKKYALNVKTNHEGSAHIPDVPLGKALIQIVADGWKSYGQYYEIVDAGATIKIHLDRPPKWY